MPLSPERAQTPRPRGPRRSGRSRARRWPRARARCARAARARWRRTRSRPPARPSRAERLGAHAGEGGLHVPRAQLRHVAGRGAHERRAARRVAQLGDARAPPPREHPPGSRPAQACRADPSRRSPPKPVGVASEHRQRRRADQHLAVDVPRQVNAEEGQRRVGHGVDQRTHQLLDARSPGAGRHRGRARCAGPDPRPRPPPGDPTTRPRRRSRGRPRSTPRACSRRSERAHRA